MMRFPESDRDGHAALLQARAVLTAHERAAFRAVVGASACALCRRYDWTAAYGPLRWCRACFRTWETT